METAGGLHSSARGESDKGQEIAAAPDDPPKQVHSRWPEWSALCLFSALVAFAIPHHEPFADEAQAWQLARSLSLASLFKTYIRYEASPGLWHFLLWMMARIHISYSGLHWICGAIAVAAAALLVFKSPFPLYLKLSLPFTYFLLFQYAVVARNYVLAPLLFFLVAILWKKNPLGVALTLGLLANVSLHTAVLSGGLAAVYAIEQFQNRKRNPVLDGRKLLFCALLVMAFYAFAIWTAWPPHDMMLSRVRGESRDVFVEAIRSLSWPICQPSFLSIPFWGVMGFWFAARHKLIYLLPVLLFSIFCGEVHVAWWHAGLLVPCLICILWVTWPARGKGPTEFDKAGYIALIVMIGTQILWSGYALFYDHYYAYSPDAAAAEFLKPYVNEGATIAVTYAKGDSFWKGKAYPSVGIEPYFDHNIYVNTTHPFWWWSDQDQSEDRFNVVLPLHPQFVVVELVALHPLSAIPLDRAVFVTLRKEGYEYRTTFCGTQPLELDPGVTICHVIYEHPGGDGSPGAKIARIERNSAAVY